MEENIIIKSKPCDLKKVCIAIVIIGAILSIIIFSGAMHNQMNYLYYNFWSLYDTYADTFMRALRYTFEEDLYFIIPFATFTFIAGLIYFLLRRYELAVTDKRIYGKIVLGKRVDLPIDSVSAISTIRLLKGVSVSTSSGRIFFLAIQNADEIYTVMNDLLIERQQKKDNAAVAATVPQSDEADQLKKYKDLLDSGVITQEEFDAKKKQLLGL